MAFTKVIKNKAYFKRYQVSLKRRRQGKTDYKARRALTRQAKNKYNSPKYRLVVRFSNRYCLCQIIYATMIGDKVMAAATSQELPRYGIKAGLANYAAAYATGLLVARRLLNKLGLEDTFEGQTEVDGEEYNIDDELEDDSRRPFKAILDIGLARTTVGAKVFAAMKGAADGGLNIPHSMKRFPGYTPAEEKGAESSFNADSTRERIFGEHVKDYMESMQEEDPQKYESHFAKYIENDIDADGIEDMYSNAHEAIRKDPKFDNSKAANRFKPVVKGNKVMLKDGEHIRRDRKINKKARMANVEARKARNLAHMQGAQDSD